MENSTGLKPKDTYSFSSPNDLMITYNRYDSRKRVELYFYDGLNGSAEMFIIPKDALRFLLQEYVNRPK